MCLFIVMKFKVRKAEDSVYGNELPQQTFLSVSLCAVMRQTDRQAFSEISRRITNPRVIRRFVVLLSKASTLSTMTGDLALKT